MTNNPITESELERLLENIIPEGHERVIAAAVLNDHFDKPEAVERAIAWFRANGEFDKSAALNSRLGRYRESVDDLVAAGNISGATTILREQNMHEHLLVVEANWLQGKEFPTPYLTLIKSHINKHELELARLILETGRGNLSTPRENRDHPNYSSLYALFWKSAALFRDKDLETLADNYFTQGESWYESRGDWLLLIELYHKRYHFTKERHIRLAEASTYAKAGDAVRAAKIYKEQKEAGLAIEVLEDAGELGGAISLAQSSQLPEEVKRLQLLQEVGYCDEGRHRLAVAHAEGRGDLGAAISHARNGLPDTKAQLCVLLARTGGLEELSRVIEEYGMYQLVFSQTDAGRMIYQALGTKNSLKLTAYHIINGMS